MASLSTNLPELWDTARLECELESARACLWGRESAADQIPALKHVPRAAALSDVNTADIDVVIALGGGAKLDAAKIWFADKKRDFPHLKLLAIPTRWGSGAEANGIAVENLSDLKVPHVGPEYLPSARTYAPQLAASLSENQIAFSCGDAISHALEGFLSPLSDNTLQGELAATLRAMMALGVNSNAEWFELSAQASAGQAASSVGLVHGIAHTLEPLVSTEDKATIDDFGHARLCSAFLAPVMRYNLKRSDKTRGKLAAHNIDPAVLMPFLEPLSAIAWITELNLTALIADHWRQIVRDGCSRTNVAMVGLRNLDDFLECLSA